MGNPTVRGRASICTFDLQFRFYSKEQCQQFIALYMQAFERPFDLAYHLIGGDSQALDEHWVHIEQGCWAHNLTKIAKILEQVDYQEEDFTQKIPAEQM